LNVAESKDRYWFPAKRYGWGWGVPVTWQGWVVLAGFFGLVLVGVILLPPHTQLGPFLAYFAALNVLLVGICLLKGEPPRWRWGNDERR
jgi:hypothetical protein